MARPAHTDSEESRHRLLVTAAGLFATHGYKGVALRKIAEDSGMTMAMIRYYFGNKAGLYQACSQSLFKGFAKEIAPLADILNELSCHLQHVAQSRVAVEEVLDQTVRAAFRAARKHNEAIRFVMRPLLDSGELEAQWSEELFVPFLGEVARTLSRPLGLPEQEIRWSAQILLAAGVRYSLSSIEELARLSNLDEAADADTVLRQVEDILVFAAQRLITGEKHAPHCV